MNDEVKATLALASGGSSSFSLGLKSRMEYTLSEAIQEKGPTSFSRKTLSEHPNLFAERSALFFTPTDRLPIQSVGVGDLDVFLPLCTPDWYDCFFIRSYMSPRLWVDL